MPDLWKIGRRSFGPLGLAFCHTSLGEDVCLGVIIPPGVVPWPPVWWWLHLVPEGATLLRGKFPSEKKTSGNLKNKKKHTSNKNLFIWPFPRKNICQCVIAWNLACPAYPATGAATGGVATGGAQVPPGRMAGKEPPGTPGLGALLVWRLGQEWGKPKKSYIWLYP